jgi:TPR repeat protein
MDAYYTCCGKSICGGCIQTFSMNWKPEVMEKCPLCNTQIDFISNADKIEKMMRRINSNDAATMDALGTCYDRGGLGLQQDESRAVDLRIRAAELGCTSSHYNLGMFYFYEHKKAIENWLLSGEC